MGNIINELQNQFEHIVDNIGDLDNGGENENSENENSEDAEIDNPGDFNGWLNNFEFQINIARNNLTENDYNNLIMRIQELL